MILGCCFRIREKVAQIMYDQLDVENVVDPFRAYKSEKKGDGFNCIRYERGDNISEIMCELEIEYTDYGVSTLKLIGKSEQLELYNKLKHDSLAEGEQVGRATTEVKQYDGFSITKAIGPWYVISIDLSK